MLDSASLRTAVDHLADRLRALPQSRLRGDAAQAGLDLARELAVEAQRLEHPGRTPRVMPDDGIFAVADQLAVAGHDLAAALAARPERSDVLDDAVRKVAATRRRAGV
ncbi:MULTISPECIES: hypothetical protein [Streptomycetaceae]|uniref:hypothetical protein n=1 Tax=Streptomycetaceae TaxID=2062 RepID=UPI000213EA50|nr:MULTISPECIES: hypothetical protein [Streptomycetaceae]MYS59101.1 hypothetical protein [Streptomyces sp. SID5468]CCB74811.1 conserved protein of unknown function [Streptantibioticus cattleyicolor NRRL 8057 = DSM 46488]